MRLCLWFKGMIITPSIDSFSIESGSNNMKPNNPIMNPSQNPQLQVEDKHFALFLLPPLLPPH